MVKYLQLFSFVIENYLEKAEYVQRHPVFHFNPFNWGSLTLSMPQRLPPLNDDSENAQKCTPLLISLSSVSGCHML